MQPFNGRRTYQALELGRADDRLTAGDRLTMIAVARHVSIQTIPDTLQVVNTCFPSLEQLAAFTGLTERAVRYSMDRMVEYGYFTTSKIEGRLLRGRKDQVKWDGRRIHLNLSVWDQIATPFDRQPDRDAGDAGGQRPKKEATPRKADPNTDAPGPAPTQATKIDEQQADKLFEWLRSEYSDHPTMQDPSAERYCSGFIRAALADALEAQVVIAVLQGLPEKTKNIVRAKGKLGGYLAQCWLDWWPRFTESKFAEALEVAASESGSDVSFDMPGWCASSAGEFRGYL